MDIFIRIRKRKKKDIVDQLVITFTKCNHENRRNGNKMDNPNKYIE